MIDRKATVRDLAMNEDMLSVDRALGPLTPELRSAIRWVAIRAVARELRDGQRARIEELAQAEANEQSFILDQTGGEE